MSKVLQLQGTAEELLMTPECALAVWKSGDAEIVGKRRGGVLVFRLSPFASSFIIDRIRRAYPKLNLARLGIVKKGGLRDTESHANGRLGS